VKKWRIEVQRAGLFRVRNLYGVVVGFNRTSIEECMAEIAFWSRWTP
jgi:hypothetical protein